MRSPRIPGLAGLIAAAFALSCGGSTPTPARPSTDTPTTGSGAPTPTGPSKPAEAPLPLWSNVRLGVLPNGLTYYVMRHDQPRQRAALWLAVDAGSLQEDDDQQGLAHFVEHMAFNGTRAYPKQKIIDYLEKIGMEFGPDVNAFTSFDETVYQLMVPTDDAQYVTKGLDVLHEWAGGIAFDAAEVTKERGVVLEEWRLGRGPWRRIFDKQAPVLFGGTRYAKRIPIGQPDILKTAPPSTLRRFYEDWYRPEMMAVIVVGDIDPDQVIAEIKTRFDDLRGPHRPRPRITAEPLAARGTQVSIETDPEMPRTSVAIHNLFPHRAEATKSSFREKMVDRLYHEMLNERLGELRRRPSAPFVWAGSSTDDMTRQFETFSRSATAKDGQAEATLEALLGEVVRVERHGFTQTELERAKRAAITSANQSAAEGDKAESYEYADEITRNFFEREFMIGRQAEADLWNELVPGITLDEVNGAARTWGGPDSRVILISGPTGAVLPTKARVLEIVAAAEQKPLDPWQDTAPTDPLIAATPMGGAITAEKNLPEIGVTEWTLSNGARVVLKPTDFENQVVYLSASSPGGMALYPDRDFFSARAADDIAAVGGAGVHSVDALEKLLAGKTASAGTWISDYEEGAWGRAATSDLETLFQLVHLRMSGARKDDGAFAAWRESQVAFLKNRTLMPETVFRDELQKILTKDHLRRRAPTVADLEQIDVDRALAIYGERFGDVSDFTFTIVGSFDPAAVRPLVETYLGSLPGHGRKEKRKDVGIRNPRGQILKIMHGGSEPKASVQITFHDDEKWSRANQIDIEILSEVLRMRLREILREDMGGVYGVGAWGYITRAPRQVRTFSVSFGCAPENADALRKAVFDEIKRLQRSGIDQSYLDKIKEQRRRAFETDQRRNDWWQGRLDDAYDFGDDPRKIVDLDAVLARVTSDRVRKSAKRFLDDHKLVTGVLLPQETAAPTPTPTPAPTPAPTPVPAGGDGLK
jgi:zinc protease